MPTVGGSRRVIESFGKHIDRLHKLKRSTEKPRRYDSFHFFPFFLSSISFQFLSVFFVGYVVFRTSKSFVSSNTKVSRVHWKDENAWLISLVYERLNYRVQRNSWLNKFIFQTNSLHVCEIRRTRDDTVGASHPAAIMLRLKGAASSSQATETVETGARMKTNNVQDS